MYRYNDDPYVFPGFYSFRRVHAIILAVKVGLYLF